MRPQYDDGIEDAAQPQLQRSVASQASSKSRVSELVVGDEESIYDGALQQRPQQRSESEIEVTRLIIQALGDMGYHQAMDVLSKESGVQVESEIVSDFKAAVLGGDWPAAETCMLQLDLTDPRHQNVSTPLVNLDEQRANNTRQRVLFLIREQKFLELLERKQSGLALSILRSELEPLKHDTERLHFLSSLIMSSSVEDLRIRASWSGAQGGSRAALLRTLSTHVSPNSMIPEAKLQKLLDGARASQVDDCLYHVSSKPVSLLLAADHQCPRSSFPMHTLVKLIDHRDEVWHVQYSPSGGVLATSSSDGTIILYDTSDFSIKHTLNWRTPEQRKADAEAKTWRGVTYLVFSPDESMLLACSQEPSLALWDVSTGLRLNLISHTHQQPVSSAAFLPASAETPGFVSGGLDRRINLYDMQGEVLHTWDTGRIYDLKVSADGRYLVAISHESKLFVWDLATRELIGQHKFQHILTCLNVSKDSKRVLISCSPKVDANNAASQAADDLTTEVQELTLPDLRFLRRLKGQRQEQFVIRSCYGGHNEQFVLSGSEDSDVYIWHRRTEQLIERISGHGKSVGSVVWNPGHDAQWASASDDGTVRIWSVRSSWHGDEQDGNGDASAPGSGHNGGAGGGGPGPSRSGRDSRQSRAGAHQTHGTTNGSTSHSHRNGTANSNGTSSGSSTTRSRQSGGSTAGSSNGAVVWNVHRARLSTDHQR